MEPLNLTQHPPRNPAERLAGVLFMARTLDKMRASLPGGDLGAYRIRGFSAQVLERLGISEDALRAAVAEARDEAAVEAWILAHTTQEQRDAINAWLPNEAIGDIARRDPTYYERYPNARKFPVDMPQIEFLAEDDRELFAREST